MTALRKITPREAQAMHGLQKWCHAVLTRTIKGQFATWREGDQVRAWHLPVLGGYCIERERWRGSLVPLTNMMIGVPKSDLHFTAAPVPRSAFRTPRSK